MKKIIIIFVSLLAVASLMLSACQQTRQTTPVTNEIDNSNLLHAADVKVLAVETFLAEIAQNVAGDRVKVESLVPLGVDPHVFEPTPQEVVKIARSQALILNGAGFEAWAAKTLENAGGKRAVIEASAGLASRKAREGEAAVMSPEEKAGQVCLALSDLSAKEETAAGSDAASAVELPGTGEAEHAAELHSLKLNASNGGYTGYVKFDVAEDGEYVIAADGGTLAVTDANGAAMEAEEALPMNCAGLNGGILLDLQPGEYIISLAGLSAVSTPFFAGSTGGHHHEGDPHFWLDPLNVVKYVENIRDGLILADPAGKDVYTRNAAAYITQLNDLDVWIKQQVAAIPAEHRLIVTNHESFGYFADRYGFKIIGTIIPSVSTGAAPSAQQMARLVDHIRDSGAIAIFLETGSNPQLAEQIAQETGVKVVSELYTHSITEPGGKAPSYIEMMKYNVRAIVEALK